MWLGIVLLLILPLFKILTFCSSWIFLINIFFNCIKMLFNLDYWLFWCPFKFCTLGNFLTLLILVLVLFRVYNHTKGWKFFSEKGHIVNILGSVGHVFSVAATQLCNSTAKISQTIVLKTMLVTVFQYNFIYKNRLQIIFVPQAVAC